MMEGESRKMALSGLSLAGEGRWKNYEMVLDCVSKIQDSAGLFLTRRKAVYAVRTGSSTTKRGTVMSNWFKRVTLGSEEGLLDQGKRS